MGAEKQKKPFSLKIAVFCLLLLAAVFFPTTVLLCGCLLPTFVAAMIDYHPQKTAAFTVGSLNLAASLPALFALWEDGHRLEGALRILSQPTTLIAAYTGAAIGWGIYYYVPVMINGLLVRKSEKRLRDIEKRQKELVRKWGPEIQG